MTSKLAVEVRHSDYGEDAGGYHVLRFDGEWVGRISNREQADKMLIYVAALEAERKPKCPDCNSVGLHHCSDPEHCGGVYWPDHMYRKLEAENEKRKADNAKLENDRVQMFEALRSYEEQVKRLEERLETYTDCFEQLGVKSLAELVERYDNKAEALQAENERLRGDLLKTTNNLTGELKTLFSMGQERDALKEELERLKAI